MILLQLPWQGAERRTACGNAQGLGRLLSLKTVFLDSHFRALSVKGNSAETTAPLFLPEGVNSKDIMCCALSQNQIASKVIPRPCKNPW